MRSEFASSSLKTLLMTIFAPPTVTIQYREYYILYSNTISIVTIQKEENGRVYSNNPQTKISQIAKKPNDKISREYSESAGLPCWAHLPSTALISLP